MSDNLPRLVSSDGEIIRAITAQDLLTAAGIYEPKGATDSELASFLDGAEHLARIVSEAKTIVGQDFIRRMDLDSTWTRHVDDWKLTSSSPEAGTVSYDDVKLAAALDALVEAEVISRKAREDAIEWYFPPAPAPKWKRKPAGIARLLKRGGAVAAAVLSAQVPQDAPQRSVKLTRNTGAS